MRARAGAAIVMAALCAAALTGCAALDEVSKTFGSVADEAIVNAAVDELEKTLTAIDGVSDVSSDVTVQGDLSLAVNVTATASAPDRKAAIGVAQAVASTFSVEAVAKSAPAFSFESDLGSFFFGGATMPPASELEEDVAYWWDVADAVGQPVGLGFNNETEGEQPGLWMSLPGDPESLDALRAIPVPSARPIVWDAPPFAMYDSLVPADIQTAVSSDELAALSEEEFQRTVVWNGATKTFQLTFLYFAAPDGVYEELDLLGSEYAPAVKRTIHDALDVAPTSGRLASIALNAGSVSLGDCELVAEVREADEELARVIAPMIAGRNLVATPGFCVPLEQG